jgi:hypothetical protein
VSAPVDSQILAALKALLDGQVWPSAVGVHVGRSDADPFELTELPAVNLLPIDEDVSAASMMGAAVGVPVLQLHTIKLVVQVVTRGGSAAEDAARSISAQCAQAIGQDPTLGGVCRELLRPVAKQWLRDDGSEQRLCRQNTLYSGGYRTYSDNPFLSV